MAEINKLRLFVKDHPKILANGDFEIGGFSIKYTYFKGGEKGPFVGMPGHWGEKDGERKWFSDVFIADDDVRKELTGMIAAEYKKWKGQQGEAPGPTDQSLPQDDGIPF